MKRYKTRLYTINGIGMQLDPEIRELIAQHGITGQEIQQEYLIMKTFTPSLKIITMNHAAYSILRRRMV